MTSVSVVIPVFNSATLVEHALRSVFAQTFRDFEVMNAETVGRLDRECRTVPRGLAGEFAALFGD